eukprot:259321_1
MTYMSLHIKILFNWLQSQRTCIGLLLVLIGIASYILHSNYGPVVLNGSIHESPPNATLSALSATSHQHNLNMDIINHTKTRSGQRDTAAEPISTRNRLNNINDPINMSLEEYLSQYNHSTIVRFIRNIENKIYFDRISNRNNTNKYFWSDASPHYYDGPFDLNPGKTCKVIRRSYFCVPHAAVQHAHVDEWSLFLDDTDLDTNTKQFLFTLQTKYNFYTNVYNKFQNNLHQYSSPFMKPTNAYIFGNSHIKQLTQSLSCLMDDVAINIFNHSHNTATNIFYPDIQKINESLPDTYDYNDTLCGEWFWSGGPQKHIRNKTHNGLGGFPLNATTLAKNREDKNIAVCSGQRLHVQYKDGSTLYYHFNHIGHMEHNITMSTMVQESIEHVARNQRLNEAELYEAQHVLNSGGLDVIVFNIGNHPWYDWENNLENDLRALNHSNKFVLFLSEWWDRAYSTKPLKYYASSRRSFDEKYPNVIWIDLMKRNTLKMLKWRKRMRDFGKEQSMVCETSDHHTAHLCLPGAPDHHTLEIIELINLLRHVPLDRN